MIGMLIGGLKAVLGKILVSLLTEGMLEWMFWKVAKLIVASTKTEHDDEFLAKLEEVYRK